MNLLSISFYRARDRYAYQTSAAWRLVWMLSLMMSFSGIRIIAQVPPSILTHPEPQTVLKGLQLKLSVSATGSEPLQYQWRKNGISISTPSYPEFLAFNMGFQDSGDYSVVVSNSFGSITSRWVQVKVVTGPLDGWTVPISLTNTLSGSNYRFSELSEVDYEGDTYFVTGSSSSNTNVSGILLTSSNGLVWSARRLDAYSRLGGVIYKNGAFLMAGPLAGFLRSSNAVDWTEVIPPVFWQGSGVSPALSRFVKADDVLIAIPASGLRNNTALYVSTNAVDWRISGPIEPLSFSRGTYGNGKYVLVGDPVNPGPLVQISTNAIDWRSISPPTQQNSDDSYTVAFGAGRFVIARATRGSEASTDFFVSSDAARWIKTANVPTLLYGLAFGGGVFVAVGPFAIYSSVDGEHWHEEFNPGAYLGLVDVEYGNHGFIAVGGTTVMRSVGLGLPRVRIDVTGSGSVARDLEQTNYQVGDQVVLTAIPSRWYRFVGWSDGVTNNPRTITVKSSDRENIYGCKFVPEQPLETVYYGSVSRLAPVGAPAILVNGSFIPSGSVRATNSAQVSLQTTFPGGVILYTLDGTAPTFSSPVYSGPLQLTRSTTIRALALDIDLSRWTEADPVLLQMDETEGHSLTATSPGGGRVVVSPSLARYSNNAPVVLTARPDPGWVFLKWRGGLSGANTLQRLNLTSDLCAEAVFGTRVSTTISGNGSVLGQPSAEVYPYGSSILLSAIPSAGNAFALWANGITGNNNPERLLVTTANPKVSALFVPLQSNEVSLTVRIDGSGDVVVNPRKNLFTKGQRVTLIARPHAGQEFLGWNGDDGGGINRLELSLQESAVVTAQFSAHPLLTLVTCPEPASAPAIDLRIEGDWSVRYEIQESIDLSLWRSVGRVTNYFGTANLSLPPPNATNRFFRALPLQ